MANKVDFLDIGMRVDSTDQIGRILLYLPHPASPSQISDLSEVLKHQNTLNAVFNDVLNIGTRSVDWFDTASSNGRPFTRVHRVDVTRDVRLESVDIDTRSVGTVVSFGPALCREFGDRSTPNHYFRIRIAIGRDRPHWFSAEVTPRDWWLLSSYTPMELTEFRLNERRSIPASLASWFEDGRFKIKTVHYFLIRDLQYELIVQHQDFRKIRLLEANLWRHYLRGRPPEDELDLRLFANLRNDRLVIYHWREDSGLRPNGSEKILEDFNAFAKFRRPKSNLVLFGVAIVLLGALGNAVQSLLVAQYRIVSGAGATEVTSRTEALWIGGLEAGLVIVLAVLAIGLRRSRRQQISKWWRQLRHRDGN